MLAVVHKEQFSKRIQQDLAGISSRVFITEFGVGLDGLKADVEQDELKQDVLRHVDQKSITGHWHNEHPEDVDIRSVCAKYPENPWCKKRYSFAQKPSANIGADVAAQMGGVVTAAAPQTAVYQN